MALLKFNNGSASFHNSFCNAKIADNKVKLRNIKTCTCYYDLVSCQANVVVKCDPDFKDYPFHRQNCPFK